MSVLVFLHKNECVEWYNVAIYSLEVKKWRANQEIAGRAWSDENDYYYNYEARF